MEVTNPGEVNSGQSFPDYATDAECLKETLNYPTHYVGMLGSTKKITAIVNYLQEIGYTSQALARLIAPIGLNIKAKPLPKLR